MSHPEWIEAIVNLTRTAAPERADRITDMVEMLVKRKSPEQLERARHQVFAAIVDEAKRHIAAHPVTHENETGLEQLCDFVVRRHLANAAGKSPEQALQELAAEVERLTPAATPTVQEQALIEASQQRSIGRTRWHELTTAQGQLGDVVKAHNALVDALNAEAELLQTLNQRTDLALQSRHVLDCINASLDDEATTHTDPYEKARSATLARADRDLAVEMSDRLFAILERA